VQVTFTLQLHSVATARSWSQRIIICNEIPTRPRQYDDNRHCPRGSATVQPASSMLFITSRKDSFTLLTY